MIFEMNETIFPPSPTWLLSNILSCQEDGTVSYGSKNNIVILKRTTNKSLEPLIIRKAHEAKVTSVAFSPGKSCENFKDSIVSASEDGLVKLWNINTLSANLGHKAHWGDKETHGKVVCLDWSLANPSIIISAADNNSLVLWNIISNTTVKYTFLKFSATALSCCPHNEKVVAVGVKSGLIFIINLAGEGEIVYKLRGHDSAVQSLSWCPTPFNIFLKNEICEEFLLASTCQNKEFLIWRAGSDGKCQAKIQIPTRPCSKKDGEHYTKLGNAFSFMAAFWRDAYTINLSSSFGELLSVDLRLYSDVNSKVSDTENHKQSFSCFTVVHNIHSKGLFAIASTPENGNIILFNDISVKSNLKFKLQSITNIRKDLKSSEELIGNYMWTVDSPKSSHLIWTAGQDRQLVACRLNESKVEIVYNLHTVNGCVYNAVTSPHDPNKIAIAVGDGVIRLWNMSTSSDKIQLFWQKIKDRVMSLAWHPTKDGLLAYGTSEGRVGLIETNTNKLPKVFKPSSPRPIYNLSWGPEFNIEEKNKTKPEFNLYFVGDFTLSVYNCSNMNADPINLTKLLPFPCKKQTDLSWKPDYTVLAVGNEDGTIYLIEPSDFKITHTLFAYKKMIQSLAWHPLSTSTDIGLSLYHTYFTSASTDNDCEVRVFNYIKKENGVNVEQVATLKGHHDEIQFVSWSPHVSGQLVSSSSDRSIQIWDVISQTPLVNFFADRVPMFSVWNPIDPDTILTGCKENVLHIWKISSQTNGLPPLMKTKKQKKDKGNSINFARESTMQTGSPPDKFKEDEVSLVKSKSSNKNTKEVQLFSKAWKSESLTISNLYSILKGENADNGQPQFSLPFFCNDQTYNEFICAKEESHKEANHLNEYYELSLWNGKLKNVIEEKMKTGELNDFLISMAPMVSPRLWQEACLAYSQTLIEKKLFRKAASYLIICHRIYEAINLLKDQHLYLEALSIARGRLPKSDPIFKDIIMGYAEFLFKNGTLLHACECYLYLGEYLQVSKICGKKNEPEYLSLAALAARKGNCEELESMEATNALLKCLELNDLGLAERICNDHNNIKHLRLMLQMYQILEKLDKKEIVLETNILDHVANLIKSAEVVFPSNNVRSLYGKYEVYKNKQKVFIIISQELTMAVCSKDVDEKLTHIIKALSTCCRYIQCPEEDSQLLLNFCTWLSPSGVLTENSCFTHKKGLSTSKIQSLREFLGAAIIRYLNFDPSYENMEWMKVLECLQDDLFDRKSLNYFKNLIEVELCEKRLMANMNSLAQKNSITKDNCCKTTTPTTESNSSNIIDENKSKEPKMIVDCCKIEENNIDCDCQGTDTYSANKIGNNETELNKIEEAGDGVLSNENVAIKTNGYNTCELFNTSEIEEKILLDRDLHCKLRSDIECFEATKISCPNPIPLLSSMKKICSDVPECEIAKALLASFEKKCSDFI